MIVTIKALAGGILGEMRFWLGIERYHTIIRLCYNTSFCVVCNYVALWIAVTVVVMATWAG